MIEHPRACGARPAMLAPSALAAGAARLQQALRACRLYSNSPLRVIEHPRACDARPATLAPSVLAAGPVRRFFVFLLLLFTPAGDRTSSRLRRSPHNARAFGACSRRCAPAGSIFLFFFFPFFSFFGPKICKNHYFGPFRRLRRRNRWPVPNFKMLQLSQF